MKVGGRGLPATRERAEGLATDRGVGRQEQPAECASRTRHCLSAEVLWLVSS